MTVPSWLWIGTPLKFSIWFANRVVTWTGAFYVWRRFRRTHRIWFWLIVINAVSLVALVIALFFLRT